MTSTRQDKADDQHSAAETKRRLEKLLHGAFSGPPQAMKDIPKKREPGKPGSRPSSRKKPKKSG